MILALATVRSYYQGRVRYKLPLFQSLDIIRVDCHATITTWGTFQGFKVEEQVEEHEYVHLANKVK